MFDENTIAQLRGKTLVAGTDEVGEIEEVFTHSGEDRPALVSVTTDNGSVLVPVPDADLSQGTISVPFGADVIAGAPAAAGDTLAEDEFEAVYDHYGIDDSTMRDQSHP